MIVDLIIIAIACISVFLGYKKGLVSLAIGLLAFVISIVVTVALYKPVTNLIINCTYVDETIQNVIIDKTGEFIEKDNDDSKITNDLVDSAKKGMLDNTSRTLAINIVSGLTMILLFVLVRFGLIFVTKILDTIAKLPILNQFNKAGGIIYGLVRGLLLIYVILLVINVFGQINPKNVLHQNVNNSYIGKAMYNNNVLNVFFQK